jgi:hypothetical protein
LHLAKRRICYRTLPSLNVEGDDSLGPLWPHFQSRGSLNIE